MAKKKTTRAKRPKRTVAKVADAVSCMGLEETIRNHYGRNLDSASKELNEMWTTAFDALGDIEEFLLWSE
jgi:hypothetical protein